MVTRILFDVKFGQREKSRSNVEDHCEVQLAGERTDGRSKWQLAEERTVERPNGQVTEE